MKLPTLADFRARWVEPPTRRELLDALVNAGYPPEVVRLIDDMTDYDLFDVIAGVGSDWTPRPRPTAPWPSATSKTTGWLACPRRPARRCWP